MLSWLAKIYRTGSYAVFGSGPLVVRGIVPDAGDLDVLCTSEAWSIVAARGNVEYLPEYDVTIASMLDGALTFGTTWGIGEFDVLELIATAETIDGLPFVRLEHVVRYKTIRNSEKDRCHLDLLKRWPLHNYKSIVYALFLNFSSYETKSAGQCRRSSQTRDSSKESSLRILASCGPQPGKAACNNQSVDQGVQ